MDMFLLSYKYLQNRQGSLTADERELLRPRSLQRDGKTYVNYTADFLWLGRCKGKLATSLRLRGAALKAFVEVGTSAAVRAVLQRASRADTSGVREELGGQPFELVCTQLKKDADFRDEKWQQIVQSRDDKWQQIVQSRDEKWQEIVQSNDEEWRQACLEQRSRDDAWRSKLNEFVEAWMVDARGTSEALAALGSSLASLPFRLGQKISDVVSAAVMSPGSALVKNLRAATKKVAVRSTHSARRFPSEQKATQLEVLSSLVSLLSVAVRFFPEMHYDVWKAIRGSFGKAAKKERVRRNGLDAASAEYLDRPLLWSFAGEGTSEGGGQRYVFLQRHVGLVEAVWTTPRSVGSGLRRRVESLDAKARRLQEDAVVRPGYVPEPWPLLSAEVEPDFASSGEDA